MSSAVIDSVTSAVIDNSASDSAAAASDSAAAASDSAEAASDSAAAASDSAAANIPASANQSIYDDILQTDILNLPHLFVATISHNISPFDFPVLSITQAFKDSFLAKDDLIANSKCTGDTSSSSGFEIIAINTNFHHFCRKGCEYDIQIKSKKK